MWGGRGTKIWSVLGIKKIIFKGKKNRLNKKKREEGVQEEMLSDSCQRVNGVCI